MSNTVLFFAAQTSFDLLAVFLIYRLARRMDYYNRLCARLLRRVHELESEKSRRRQQPIDPPGR